jgi:hypothetical protein
MGLSAFCGDVDIGLESCAASASSAAAARAAEGSATIRRSKYGGYGEGSASNGIDANPNPEVLTVTGENGRSVMVDECDASA